MSTGQGHKIYLAYGSNMWLAQMLRRCPGSTLVGVGVLRGWRWFICGRGYANVRERAGGAVYGLLYGLTPEDEEALDGYEGVPVNYVKRTVGVEVGSGEVVDCLVYVDVERVTDGVIKEEYIARMTSAIQDASEKGVPERYIEECIKPYLTRSDARLAN